MPQPTGPHAVCQVFMVLLVLLWVATMLTWWWSQRR